MPILLALVVLWFPRLLLLWLKFFSEWFSDVRLHLFWQVLGFLFMPFTLLWYVAVVNLFEGRWEVFQEAVLVIAILTDLGGGFKALRKRS